MRNHSCVRVSWGKMSLYDVGPMFFTTTDLTGVLCNQQLEKLVQLQFAL